MKPNCKICEFEEGWGKPFCGACGQIFDEVPILQRIREYVAGVNDDYKEDEERDQTLGMIDALILHNVKSDGNPANEMPLKRDWRAYEGLPSTTC